MTFRALLSTLALSGILISMTADQTGAQEVKRRVLTFEEGKSFFIPGLGAIVEEQDGKLLVRIVPSSENRDKKFKDVDLAEGDQILMVEGKKVSTATELKKRFESAEVGSEVKLGIRRGKDMMIRSIERVKQEDGGGGKVMTVTRSIVDATADGNTSGEKTGMTIEGDGSSDVLALPDAGLVLMSEKEGMIVAGEISDPSSTLTGDKPSNGDRVLTINGKGVANANEFSKIYEATSAGDNIMLTLLRGTDTLVCSFVKADMNTAGAAKKVIEQ